VSNVRRHPEGRHPEGCRASGWRDEKDSLSGERMAGLAERASARTMRRHLIKPMDFKKRSAFARASARVAGSGFGCPLSGMPAGVKR
jgi:hypothetical protein